MAPKRFRLIALDVDGTLLDSSGVVRPAVRSAVSKAQERGFEVVLCTGRRYRTALPVLAELDLVGAAVVQNGTIVKDVESGRTLHHDYLPSDLYPLALDTLRRVGPPLVYIDHHHDRLDMVTEPIDRLHPFQGEYFAKNQEFAQVVESLDTPPSPAVTMMSCMADRESCESLRELVSRELGEQVRTNFLMNKNYRGYILEIVSARSGKWPALERLARERGIAAEQILAIGDDRNDAEMIAGAGLGVAMGNAVDEVIDAADAVTASNDEDGVALAIERYLLGP